MNVVVTRVAVLVVREVLESAPPMPCTVPPAIWPSTTLGLIIGPQSSLTM